MNSFDTSRKRVICSILELETRKIRLTAETASQNHKALFDEAVELFGTWTLALEYAGVRIGRRRKKFLAPKIVIQEIRGRVGRLNCVRAMHIRKVNHTLYRAGIETFGSWNLALVAAGVDPQRLYFGSNNPRLNKEQILELLRTRASEGKSMRLIDFACENLALARNIQSQFRSWNAALIAAGLIKIDQDNREP